MKTIKKKLNAFIKKNKRVFDFVTTFLIILLILVIISTGSNNDNLQDVPYSVFETDLKNGDIDTVYIDTTHLAMRYTLLNDETRSMDIKERENVSENDKEWKKTQYPAYDTFVKEMTEGGVIVKRRTWSPFSEKFLSDPFSLICMILFGFLIYSQFKMMNIKGGANKPVKDKHLDVEFSDIIGHDEALDELKLAIKLMQDEEGCKKMGVKPPKGILLSGPPGTGKTMIAKAMAKEGDMTFFNIDSSSLIEMFVGVGASRIRNVFQEARRNKPAVIFLDEIDAIGLARSQTNGSREHDQTLDALLQEMDGFGTETGVFVIAATNREKDLDPALLRPGRFDRKIILNPPKDWNTRVKLIESYCKGIDMSEVDIETIARQISGFSGADIANLVNEAKRTAILNGTEHLTTKLFDEAIEKVLLSGNRTKRAYKKDVDIVSVHESGHAVSMYINKLPIARISIIPNTAGVGGMVINSDMDTQLYSKEYLESRIKALYAGRIAESLVFGEKNITTGASNDILVAKELIMAYLADYGFDNEAGLVVNRTSEHIEERAKDIAKKMYEVSYSELADNVDLINRLADAVRKEETLSGNIVMSLLSGENDSLSKSEEEVPI